MEKTKIPRNNYFLCSFPLILFIASVFLTSYGYAHRRSRIKYKTPHFRIAIDVAKQSRLPEIAAIFENCYAVQSKYFEYEAKKPIQVVLADEDDLANGGAFAAQGWIVIYLPGAQFDIRDQFAWLPNVIAHELGHIITLQKMGLNSKFLGVQLDAKHWAGQHVNTSGSFNIPKGDIPNWLAEGLAQYSSQICGNDTLSTIRRMVLKTALLSDELLNLKEMGTFAFDRRKNEQIYTQGYALVEYMYRQFGRKKMNRMMARAAKVSVDQAVREAFGQSVWSIRNNWVNSLKRSFEGAGGVEYKPHFSSRFIGKPPYLSQSPAHLTTPENQWLHTSSHANDYGMTSLYRRLPNHFPVKIYHHVSPQIRLNDQGTKALFISKKVYRRPFARLNELYELDCKSWKSHQITFRGRILAATYDEMGHIYAIRDNMGQTTLGRVSQKSFVSIELKNDSLEWRDIMCGPQPDQLFAVGYKGRQSNIYLLHTKRREYVPVFQTPWQERDPYWDGKSLWFSSDRNGVFNIYSMSDMRIQQWTNASSGAFHPVISNAGLSFQTYTSKGYESSFIATQDLKPIAMSSEYPLSSQRRGVRKPASIEAEPIWERDGRRFLGFGANVKYHGHPAQDIEVPDYTSFAIDDEQDNITVGIEKFHNIDLGGELIWLHPGMESMLALYVQATGNIEEENSDEAPVYLSGLQAIYQNQLSTLNWSNQFYYEKLKYPDYYDIQPVYRAFGLSSMLSLPISRHTEAAALGIVDIGWLADNREDKMYAITHGMIGGGAGVAYGRYEPGQDFVNQGLAGQLYGIIIPLGGVLLSGGLSVFENVARTLFVDLQVNILSAFIVSSGDDESSVDDQPENFQFGASIGGTLYFDLPFELSIAGRKLRGFAIKRLFPYVSANAQYPQSEPGLYPLKNRLNIHIHNKHIPNYPVYSKASDDFFEDSNVATAGSAGLIFKALSIFSYQVFWHFAVSLPLDDFSADPTWNFSLQL